MSEVKKADKSKEKTPRVRKLSDSNARTNIINLQRRAY